MKSQCLPFQQIPHTTRLFLDYLSYTPSVRSFYPRSPMFSEWVKNESQRVVYDNARRGKVSDLYREFQVSPQGEWVDLDIDRGNPKQEGGWGWNSGFAVKARIDGEKKVWFGEMRIPIRALYAQPERDARRAKAGDEMRINCFRIQGGPVQERVYIAWQPPNKPSYHTPEAFGRLVLVK